MNSDPGTIEVEDNVDSQRWEARVDGYVAVAQYKRLDNAIVFTHTEVPSELSGRGIANLLVRTALEDVRARGLAVVPFCPFVASYIRRHGEYEPLVPPEYKMLVQKHKESLQSDL